MIETSPRCVNCTSLDTVRIEVLGEGRAHSILAKTILEAFEKPEEKGSLVELAHSVLQYAEILDDLRALSGDPERALKKMRHHVVTLVVDARLALGMSAFKE